MRKQVDRNGRIVRPGDCVKAEIHIAGEKIGKIEKIDGINIRVRYAPEWVTDLYSFEIEKCN